MNPGRPAIRVMHVITGLGAGGAEAMLYKLVGATRGELSHSVVSLTDEGVFGPRLHGDGIPVSCLEMRPGIPSPLALARLVQRMRRTQPDVVQGWMYHANLLAGIAGAVARVPVVWGIHHTDVDPSNAKRLTHWTRLLSARLSRVLAARIVCCADSALRSHAKLGYCEDRMVVIHNGFVLDRFRPDAQARAQVRQELSIPEGAPVIGLVARVHPDKDHRNFLAAAEQLARSRGDAIFLLVGDGTSPSSPSMAEWVEEFRIRSRVRLLGLRSDVPRLLAAMDVLASSSRSEGFPQVLGEAMLCGVPCAVTDCGDSREIVGPTGRVVPARDPTALAGSILELLALPPAERVALGLSARQRIVDRYDIRAAAQRYSALYAEVCGRPPPADVKQRSRSDPEGAPPL